MILFSGQTVSSFVLRRALKDHARLSIELVVQRQVTFAAALILAGYYYSLQIATLAGVMIVISEALDFILCRRILQWTGRDTEQLRTYYRRLIISTILSAAIIVYYAVSLALVQGPGPHFMSLFFLFAAAIFAAMNNHQVPILLTIRLIIYGMAFVFIPAFDIWMTGAGIRSELWAQLFTALFVLYFVIDCSRIHLRLYRDNLVKMEDLTIQHELAQDAVRIKTDFLSTMSHELRTPLTSIKGSIDLISSGKFGALNGRIVKLLDISQRNCARLIALIDEILDLQKIDAGKMEFHMQPVEVTALIGRTVALTTPYADALGVTLRVEGEGGGWVLGDPARLEQVLTNMLSNAAKFSTSGDMVRVRAEAQPGRIRICVIDEGVGLSENDTDKVFDRFSQLDASDTRKIGGTGLGMNISRKIMAAHDGVISYAKNTGPGTTFYMELDICDPAA
ncbi:sensor histidine kinase [Loktanella fryxellensis]|nr:HAMP domain-containing sensor histidine kinase [Loktanella fryxellensis]